MVVGLLLHLNLASDGHANVVPSEAIDCVG